MTQAWKQIAIAFVLGAASGYAVAERAAPRMHASRWGGGGFHHRLLDRFSSKLHLTPEQRSQVAAILEAKRQKIEGLRGELRPRFEEIRASTSADIRQLLTPAQQQKFDVMKSEWDARKERVRNRWDRGEDRT